MKKLKDIFKKAAQDNFLLRGFINNSERIVSLGYLTGNIILATKQGLDVNLETLSGGLFLTNAALMFFAGKNPGCLKLGGAFTMAGAVALGVAGTGEPGAVSQIVSTSPIFLSGYMMTRNAIETITGKAKDCGTKGALSSAFNKASSFMKKMPLVSAGFLALSGIPFLINSAIQKGDIGLGAVAAAWIIADLALSASDPAIKSLTIKNNRAPSPAP